MDAKGFNGKAAAMGFLVPSLLFASAAAANGVSPYFTYQGRVFESGSTNPLLHTVSFKLQIRSANGTCLLYEELHPSVNLSATSGLFNLAVGSIAGDSKRTGDDPGLTMAQVFSNTGVSRAAGTNCSAGYTPSAGDKRRLRVTIIDGATETTLTPDQDLVSVPYATVAETLQGRSPSDFISVTGAVTQSKLSDLSSQHTELMALAAQEAALTALAGGTSNLYLKPAAGGVSLSGVGDIKLSDQKSLQLGSFTNAQQATLAASLSSQGAAAKGTTWFNSDSGRLVYWDGSQAQSLGTAAAIANFAPTFGVQSGEIAEGNDARFNPAFTAADAGKFVRLNDTGSAYVLRTPAEIKADLGLGTAADNSDGDVFLVTNALSELTVITRPVARANLGLGGAATLGVGTTSGTVAAGNDARFAPSPSGNASAYLRVNSSGTAYETRSPSNVLADLGGLSAADYNADVAAISGCTTSQTVYWNSGTDAFACANIALAGSAITSGTVDAARLPAAASGAAGIVTASAQTLSGAKTFADTATFQQGVSVTGDQAVSGQVTASGGIKVGTNSTTCNASAEGAFRYNTVSKRPEFCDGTAWRLMAVFNPDTTPDSFSFTNVIGASVSTVVTSNTVTLAGFDGPVSATLAGTGSPEIKVNSGSWSAGPVSVSPGDTVTLRLTAASASNMARSATLTVGSYSADAWQVMTGLACPTGFVAVPALAGYTVQDFCVAKHEMRDVGGVATSTGSGDPWYTNVSRNVAIAKCQALGTGYDLISNAQWQTIARNVADVAVNWSSGVAYSGTLNAGHTDNAPGSPIAGDPTEANPCFNTNETCSSTVWNSQRRTHVLSNGNIVWDMSGNVVEWVKDDYPSSPGASAMVSQFTSGTAQTDFGNDQFCNGSNFDPYCGWGKAWIGVANGAIVRGGGFTHGITNGGLFMVNLGSAPGDISTTGFRCVYQP